MEIIESAKNDFQKYFFGLFRFFKNEIFHFELTNQILFIVVPEINETNIEIPTFIGCTDFEAIRYCSRVETF